MATAFPLIVAVSNEDIAKLLDNLCIETNIIITIIQIFSIKIYNIYSPLKLFLGIQFIGITVTYPSNDILISVFEVVIFISFCGHALLLLCAENAT